MDIKKEGKDDLNFLRLINDFNLNVIGFRAYYEEEEENKDQDSFNLSFNKIYLAYESEITIYLDFVFKLGINEEFIKYLIDILNTGYFLFE